VVSEAGIAVDAVVFSVPEVVINNVESFGVFVVSVAGLIIGGVVLLIPGLVSETGFIVNAVVFLTV